MYLKLVYFLAIPLVSLADEDLTASFYNIYLQRIIKTLQKDDNFRENIKRYSMDEIKAGELEEHLHEIPHDLKDELNSHKRKEIDRIRRLIRARNDLQAGHKVPAKSLEINDIATHMDHADPHFFTETDIHRLLTTAVKNLEDTDTYRHERFREYEMRKAIKRENFLSHLTPVEREQAERNEKVKDTPG